MRNPVKLTIRVDGGAGMVNDHLAAMRDLNLKLNVFTEMSFNGYPLLCYTNRGVWFRKPHCEYEWNGEEFVEQRDPSTS